MAGGGVPTAAETAARRSSSARGFPARRAAKLGSNSCSKRRGSYWGGRIGWRRGGGRGSTVTGAYQRGGERRRGGSGGSPATRSGLGALVRRGEASQGVVVGNGRWTAAAHGEQRVVGVEEGGRRWCLAVWGEWRTKERAEWKERELVTLLSQKRGGEGGVHGRLLRRRGGGRQSRGAAWHARERAREEKLGWCSGWGRRVEAKAAGGGAGEDLAWR
jgi:hypothetical protein